MNSLRVKLKNIDAQAVATWFRYTMENVMLVVTREKNLLKELVSLNGTNLDGCLIENRLFVLCSLALLFVAEAQH